MSRTSMAAIAIGVIALFLLFTCVYTVNEGEQVVLLEFGEVQAHAIEKPGLHFKLPWYEARRFDRRWLAWDGDPNQITTLDKRYILIDVFARWRIIDPLVFIEKLRDEESAQGRLDDILDSATRNVIANHNLIESIRSSNRTFNISEEEREYLNETFVDAATTASLSPPPPAAPPSDGTADAPTTASGTAAAAPSTAPVAPLSSADPSIKGVDDDPASLYRIAIGRHKITQDILEKAATKVRELGIELRDVRIKRIDYIESVQRSVFDRMISERLKVAARLRSQGDGLSAEILGRKERDLKQIRSEAYRSAEDIKGRADATAARVYAEAYEKDEELYQFLKTLESYRMTLGQQTWLLLTTNSDYGKYLKSAK